MDRRGARPARGRRSNRTSTGCDAPARRPSRSTSRSSSTRPTISIARFTFSRSQATTVIGYAGLTADDDAEVVRDGAPLLAAPRHRRPRCSPTFAARPRRLERDSILVICEDAAPVALAWMHRLGAALDSAERRMVVSLGSEPRAARRTDSPMEIRRRPRPTTTVVVRSSERSSTTTRANDDSSALTVASVRRAPCG